jgi:hypothetical protein
VFTVEYKNGSWPNNDQSSWIASPTGSGPDDPRYDTITADLITISGSWGGAMDPPGGVWINGIKSSTAFEYFLYEQNAAGEWVGPTGGPMNFNWSFVSLGGAEVHTGGPQRVRGFHGEISGVAVFNRALTDAEVLALYQAGKLVAP